MLHFIRRGPDTPQPIGDLPRWLSALLRNRGVDTPEKAQRFLHPDVSHLHDPFLMQDMDKAVDILKNAAREKLPVMVYGDYDVDGVCASSIMLETLADLGIPADYRIPSRHGEGYGLNKSAVREIAQTHKILLTVDCGITNHSEVRLAQMLGMTVVVTDHHELADTPSPGDAVLNPLLGDYPFRRLCGAGVALKVTQALLGMEGVMKRIDLAALATIADIVPLIDENRIIVREGLKQMEHSGRPGIRALKDVSGIQQAVTASDVAFRLAPRINAGGRLEDASQGVSLLTSREEVPARAIAMHLEECNQQRKGVEQDIINQCMKEIESHVDFRNDLVILVSGEGWNAGVIGLAAGRICEKYHFPTVVLSVSDGVAVGSCRSIEGVNIHGMLSTCKDLFQRFGGHAMAAGLTMDAALIPELRRRLNLAIRENCDLRCYIPAKEYDLTMPLQDVTLETIEALDLMQPTGCGNPEPMMLTCDCHVQQMRRVGASRQHLKVSLLEGQHLRDGIAFGLGDMAEDGLERVDVLYAPERNVYMGRVTPQLQVKALRPAKGTASLPPAEGLFPALLQEIAQFEQNVNKMPADIQPAPLPKAALNKLMQSGRGVLLICHERERAAAAVLDTGCDAACVRVRDGRGFNTLVMNPDISALTDIWQQVVLLDGDVLPGECAAIREKCPRAEVFALKANPAFTALLDGITMADEPLRDLYRALRSLGPAPVSRLAEEAHLTPLQVMTGLTAFSQVGLAKVSLDPYAIELLPPVKCSMEDSSLIHYLRSRK